MGKSEIKFYKCFEKVIGEKYLKSKFVNNNISKDDIFLSSNYKDYNFDDNIVNIIEKILKEFKSDLINIPSRSLVSYIDGIIVKHSNLGYRIIEFDEEQHFNPYREKALTILKENNINLVFIENYIELCKDIKHFNLMIKKHRIKYKTNKIIDLKEFNNIINISNNNNYIKQKKGFDFLGGRVAQRAYYDMLRDLAYLSPKNPNLKQIIRFSKYEIEREFQNKFEKLSDKDIENFIKRRLNEFM